MQFPESWLREFCDPAISTRELADLLTMSGLEVEEIRPVAPSFSNVVVAEVLSIEPHPNADRLRVCQVQVGLTQPLQIVCGAPNVAVGMKVPCALVDAVLPAGKDGEPLIIRAGELRGVQSLGMLCSAQELQISCESSGLMALQVDAPVGQNLRSYLHLDDSVFTLKLTPNLGHCLSVYGIAREVSALTGSPLKTLSFAPAFVAHPETLTVDIKDKDLCGRFSGRVILEVNPEARTPEWMVQRLERSGQRPVSALVDISNYVMFELGRPSHMFDLDKINGNLIVRWGEQGERLELLNGQTVEVDSRVGVIADQHGLESLAGIMGGQSCAVSDATTKVYLEAAFWWPQAIAGRARRYGFSTEAAHRFERGVDPSSTVEHIERITHLVQQICGGQAGPIVDQIIELPQPHAVELRVDRAAKVIGMPLSQSQCEQVMQRLGLAWQAEPGRLRVTPPPWRFDIQIEEDLIEEVARSIGYQNLPTTLPVAPVRAQVRPERLRSIHAVKHALAALDYFETINFSFVEERWESELAGNAHPIRVLNPIASPLSVMRSSLMGSLIQVLRHNLARKAARVRVFEVGRVFMRDKATPAGELTVPGIRQPMRVAGLGWGPTESPQWGSKTRNVDFYDLKGDLELLLAPQIVQFQIPDHPHPALHPGRSADIVINKRVVGVIGELHPRWRQSYELPAAPILFEIELDALLEQSVPLFKPVSKFQPVLRDLAVVLRQEVSCEQLLQVVRNVPTPLLRSVELFDVYKPSPGSASDLAPNEASLALRIELLDEEHTLTDERIEVAVALIISQLNSQLGARLRG
jgi:phenylalanyl-tRNA synthetase beta chain